MVTNVNFDLVAGLYGPDAKSKSSWKLMIIVLVYVFWSVYRMSIHIAAYVADQTVATPSPKRLV